jgi:hypothetical protein
MMRLARAADVLAVHELLWSAKAEIPLADNFVDAAHKKWVREQCGVGRVWVFEQEGDIMGVPLTIDTQLENEVI